MKLFTMSSILLAALLLPGAAWTAPRTAAPSQAAVERTVPPQLTGQAPDQILPEIVERRLDNGVPVYIAVRPKLPIEEIYFVFPEAVCKNDPPGKYGLAETTLGMMTEGAGNRDILAFNKAVDMLGSRIGALRGFDTLAITVSCLTERLPETVDLAADAIMLPAFPQRELERRQKQFPDNYSFMRTSPRFLPGLAFRRLLYGEEARYGTFKGGTPQQIAAITRQDLVDYHAKYFTPDKMFICCCGSADPDAVTEILNKRVGRWAPGRGMEKHDGSASLRPVSYPKSEPRYIPAGLPENAPMNGRLFIVDRPGAQQAVIRVGCLGVTVKDPDRLAIQAMNTLLGGSFASRLNDNLRERNGYTYGASSGFDFRLDRGAFAASTSVQTDKVIPAVREMLKEIDRMHQPVPKDELQRTLNYMAYAFPSGFEAGGSVTALMTKLIGYDYPKDYVDTYVSNVLKLTPEEIKKAADRTLDVKQMKVIIVGDAKALEPQLKEAGWRAQVLTMDEVMGPKMTAE